MSLPKESLQLIIDNAMSAAEMRLETSGHSLAIQPEGVKLINLEKYQAWRDRFRATFKTHSLADFTKYTATHVRKDVAGAGFIDQDEMSAKVLFNLGNHDEAGHGDDTATLTLKQTAAYKALCSHLGTQLSQMDLAEFLEDWAPNIQAFAGEDDLNIVQAITGIRKMTIKATSQRDSNVGDFANTRSAMDEIEARSQETLPTRFEFTTPPYEGLSAATINLRLSVITGKETPILKLRWVGEEAQKEAFAQEFKEVLHKEVGGLVALTIGTLTLAA